MLTECYALSILFGLTTNTALLSLNQYMTVHNLDASILAWSFWQDGPVRVLSYHAYKCQVPCCWRNMRDHYYMILSLFEPERWTEFQVHFWVTFAFHFFFTKTKSLLIFTNFFHNHLLAREFSPQPYIFPCSEQQNAIRYCALTALGNLTCTFMLVVKMPSEIQQIRDYIQYVSFYVSCSHIHR